MYKNYHYDKNVNTILKLLFSLFMICGCFFQGYSFASDFNRVTYSLFAEGGETESVFIIDGRNFPVSGSVEQASSSSNNSLTIMVRPALVIPKTKRECL